MTDKMKELREKAERATPGPWSYDPDEDEIHADACATSDNEPWHVIPSQTTGLFQMKDAEFIAAWNPSTALQVLNTLELAIRFINKKAEYDSAADFVFDRISRLMKGYL